MYVYISTHKLKTSLFVRPYIFLGSATPFFTNEPILVELYVVAVYDPMMCMKVDIPGPKYFRGY